MFNCRKFKVKFDNNSPGYMKGGYELYAGGPEAIVNSVHMVENPTRTHSQHKFGFDLNTRTSENQKSQSSTSENIEITTFS